MGMKVMRGEGMNLCLNLKLNVILDERAIPIKRGEEDLFSNHEASESHDFCSRNPVPCSREECVRKEVGDEKKRSSLARVSPLLVKRREQQGLAAS